MKPRVFLSHSSKDRPMIERIAHDLQPARIDVWFADWEIPPGESFRRRIFEEGIPNCDLFFAYLTPHSATSYWVSRELDAAFVLDAQQEGSLVALFVDSDRTRRSLSSDLQALHSPILNQEDYERPIRQLICRAWEGALKRQLERQRQRQRLTVLELEKRNAELQATITQLQMAGFVDTSRVIDHLKTFTYGIEERSYSLAEVFTDLAYTLAAGASDRYIKGRVGSSLELSSDYGPEFALAEAPYQLEDFLGPLVVAGLVRFKPPDADSYPLYYLTDLGVAVARELNPDVRMREKAPGDDDSIFF